MHQPIQTPALPSQGNRGEILLKRWSQAIAADLQSQLEAISRRDWSALTIGCLLLGLPLGTTALALHWISTPPQPRCQQSDPFRSDLAELQCLRRAMDSAQPQAVIAGLQQLQNWPQASPVYRVAQQLRQDWSQVAYSMAQEAFEAGEWQTAAQLTAMIPQEAPLGEKAQARLGLWQQIQAQGERAYDLAQEALQGENWSQALQYAETLANLQNDYWRRQGLHELPSIIAQGQQQDSPEATEADGFNQAQGPILPQPRPSNSSGRSRPGLPVLISLDRLRVSEPQGMAPEFSLG
jgi:hypothetical protein